MHTKELSELDGLFSEKISSNKKCKKCNNCMKYKIWKSSCGGYEDYKYTCTNENCNYSFWVEGIDS